MSVKASWPGCRGRLSYPPLRVLPDRHRYAAFMASKFLASNISARIASRSFVFPWSTCPITVTIGGLGRMSSGFYIFRSMIVSSYRETYLPCSHTHCCNDLCSCSIDLLIDSHHHTHAHKLAYKFRCFEFILRASSDTVITSRMSIFLWHWIEHLSRFLLYLKGLLLFSISNLLF
jgi:hypothetical protein